MVAQGLHLRGAFVVVRRHDHGHEVLVARGGVVVHAAGAAAERDFPDAALASRGGIVRRGRNRAGECAASLFVGTVELAGLVECVLRFGEFAIASAKFGFNAVVLPVAAAARKQRDHTDRREAKRADRVAA